MGEVEHVVEAIVVLVPRVIVDRVSEVLTVDRHGALCKSTLRVGGEHGFEAARKSLAGRHVLVIRRGRATFCGEPSSSGLCEVANCDLAERQSGAAGEGRQVPQDIAE